MSADIIPIRSDLKSLWDAYATLARQAADNPRLASDPNHAIACVRAHRRWAEAFNASDVA